MKSMSTAIRACLATAVIASAACAVALPAQAGGLNEKSYGSVKDFGYVAPRAAVAGPCYIRGDIGGSIAATPSVSWPVNSLTRTWDTNPSDIIVPPGDDPVTGVDDVRYTGNLISTHTTYLGSDVSNVEIENTWFGDVGLGCGSGSKGFRIEGVLSFRGEQKVDGEPEVFTITDVFPDERNDADTTDPLHTSLRSTTLMANLYYDLGNYNGFVPYVGFGLGVAYHNMGDVSFTENEFLTNTIEGNSDLAFAWSLMAGFGYQITHNAVLDVGYRYIDMGKIKSGRVDSAHFVNPPVVIEDIAAHEIKVGLRYHFGTTSAPAVEYTSMK
jgi:opacity protein-like surface antigen